jgi:hypothetical protein
MQELPDRGFPFRSAQLAVKVFGDDHLGGQDRPGLGHLDVFLFENDPPRFVGDLGRAPFPFDLVEGVYLRIAEDALNCHGFPSHTHTILVPALGGNPHRHPTRHRWRRQNFFVCIDHVISFRSAKFWPSFREK